MVYGLSLKKNIVCPFIAAINWSNYISKCFFKEGWGHNHNHNLKKGMQQISLVIHGMSTSTSQAQFHVELPPPSTLTKKHFSANRTSKQHKHKHVKINMKKQNLLWTKKTKGKIPRRSSQCFTSCLGSPDKWIKVGNKLYADTVQRVVWSKLHKSVS